MATIYWENESELALKAVSSGIKIALNTPEKLTVAVKESHRDVVTPQDLVLERHIASILAKSNYPILGEESFAENPKILEQISENSPYWIVDPIDGTANYVAGIPFYSISIGLAQNDQFLIGAIALPESKEIFFSHGSSGAFLNGRQLLPYDAQLQETLVCACFSSTASDSMRKLQIEVFGKINARSRGCLRLGSAAASIAYTAAGKFQVTYGFGIKVWDVAAGLALARQAGCALDIQIYPSRTELDFVVGAPTAVAQLCKIISEEKRLFHV